MRDENWKGRIRFQLLGEYYFEKEYFAYDFPQIGNVTIIAADSRLENLKDSKFGVQNLGATGKHLFAVIEETSSIQDIFKRCVLLQQCLLTIPSYKEIAVDPGYQQLLIDFDTDITEEEIKAKYVSNGISFGIEIFKQGSFVPIGGGIYSQQQINQKTFQWNNQIDSINSNHPFQKELTNSLYLLNLSYINPRSYLSIILRVSSIEALVKPNEISEELKISPKTVDNQMRRAFKLLREKFGITK